VLFGEGANGKSTLLQVYEAMLGEQNVSHVQLESFAERFQVAPMVGKLANVASEVGNLKSVNAGILKQLVAGDSVTIDKKYKDPASFKPTAKLVFATNQLPRFGDSTEGFWRRPLIIPCSYFVRPEDRDPHLGEKLKAELPGILNWSVAGLMQLRQQNSFTEPAISVAAAQEYRQDSCPARTFLQEEVQVRKGAWVQTQHLYQRYTKWATDRGLQVLPEPDFGREVTAVHRDATRTRITIGGDRVYVREGICLGVPDAPSGEPRAIEAKIELDPEALSSAAGPGNVEPRRVHPAILPGAFPYSSADFDEGDVLNS
jgi:putative DNA primase/helicase